MSASSTSALFVVLIVGAVRQAPPPPAHLTHTPQPLLPHRPLDASAHHHYALANGFVGAGADVAPSVVASCVADALAECRRLVRCLAITFEGAANFSRPTEVFFKSRRTIVAAHNWATWYLTAPVTPPVETFNVGGASRLHFSLREDFYSVQNLSRVGENWSFTRPLSNVSSIAGAAHLGDVTLRLRTAAGSASRPWDTFSTTGLGAKAIPLPTASGGRVLAAQDITDLLAATSDAPLPLKAVRSYERSADGAGLILRLNLTSTSPEALELGGLGFALPESDGRPPAHISSVVWADPHVGGEGGWVEFVRVVEDEATLLVVPADSATGGEATPLEAWRPMLEDMGDGDAYEWTVASTAWATEWAQTAQWPFLNVSDWIRQHYPPFAASPETPWPCADGKKGVPRLASAPWNAPTSVALGPRETRSFALRLQLAAGGPRTRDAALEQMGRPFVHAVPGYTIGVDQENATLFVTPPRGAKTVSVAASPASASSSGAITFARRPSQQAGTDVFGLALSGRGRVTAVVRFSDGTAMTVHYHVVPPFSEQVHRFGRFSAEVAWLPREYPDAFGRSASVMPWDRSLCSEGFPQCGGHVLDDARAYDVGLSDDAGGGGPLGLASKVRAAPTQREVARVDEYIHSTLYGIKPDVAMPPFRSLQITEEQAAADPTLVVDGIRMTMYYYSDNLSNSTSGHFAHNYSEADKCRLPFGSPTWCMNEKMSNATYRGFNYPHQIASYWAMYTVARFKTLLSTLESWEFYLYRAAKTSLCPSVGTAGVGFMDGTVLREVLRALEEEATAEPTAGWGNSTFAELGAKLRANMRVRQQQWAAERYPYGSEFGFDTTGQEEVVVWNLFFGNMTVAERTVDHVLSYMRSSPTWAYHGGGRSLGDVGNNGLYLLGFGTGVADRGLMHYRAGLNAIPLIEWYRRHPNDIFTLEVAMGAIGGQMANIDDTGAPSMMFHALAHALEYDPHSGDYGLGFFGNALESAAYLVHHPVRGRLCYLCSLGGTDGSLLLPRDGYSIAVFLEPLALYLQTDCGTIESIALPASLGSGADGKLAVTLAPTEMCAFYRLRLTKTSTERPGEGFAVEGAPVVRGAFESKVESGQPTTVVVRYHGRGGAPPRPARDNHAWEDDGGIGTF